MYFLTAILWPSRDKLGHRPIENEQIEAVKRLVTRHIALVVRNDGSGSRLHAMHWREPKPCSQDPAALCVGACINFV